MAWKGYLSKFDFSQEQLKAWWALRAKVRKISPKCWMCGHFFLDKELKIVDHKRPHRGDAKLLLDTLNLQVLCVKCHNSKKQIQERNADKPAVGLDGWAV